MSDPLLKDLHAAFVTLHDEIREEGGEFDFRFSLVNRLFIDALGWSRSVGEGHVNFEDDRKDVLCYDDSDPPFPVIVCETKRPSHDLDLDDVEQLERYMVGVGSANYGILTNGYEVRLYDYDGDDRSIRGIDNFEVESIASEDFEELSETKRAALGEFAALHHDRFVDLAAAEYFRETYQEVPVQYQPGTADEGYELFLEAIKDSLGMLTDVLKDFFQDYRERDEDSYPRKFLDSTFPDWREWREYTGQSGNAKEAFCRETAYIILNRALFARIAEDKEIVGHTRLSYRGMARALDHDGDQPYLDALMETYDDIDDHYPDLYELGIFDWWWVSRDKRQRFDRDEERRQEHLDEALNYTLGTVLKRLNRFDFEYVNRDILGHVYEDYLPKQERKELGEYYTPLEVVQYMLDSVGYKYNERIGGKKVLDPACGSGTFLTEVTERLIQHHLDKFGKTSVHRLQSDEARTILERIEQNVYGIDINPFAAHISQINLLFRTIDLYDKITEKDPDYKMSGFEIHVADTLLPTIREQESIGSDSGIIQSGLAQFKDYNGRAEAFLEDIDAVDNIKENEEFDIVVANPPYVSTQNMNTEAKSKYMSFYDDIQSESADIYIPFIERGRNWLSDNGSLAYICPDRLNTTEYAKLARDSLSELEILHMIQFKETEVFDVSTPYPMIITANNKEPSECHEVKLARFAEEKDGILDDINHLDEWNTNAEEYDLFYYPQSELIEDNSENHLKSWKPMPDDEKQVIEKIEQNGDVRLKTLSEAIFQGIITGRDKIFIGEIIEELDDETVRFRPSGHDEDHIVQEAKIEKSILKRILKGPDIAGWDADWRGLWSIFPYKRSGDTISQDEFESEYLNTWAYLNDHSDSLKGRRVSEWWDYSRKQNISKIQNRKYIVRVNSDEPTLTLDEQGRYIFVGSGGGSGGYGMILSEDQRASEQLLHYGALLMSDITEYYVEHISAIFGEKYYQYNERFLSPIPIVKYSEETEAVANKAEEIVELMRNITELEYKMSNIENYLSDFEVDSKLIDLPQGVDLADDNYRQDPIRKNDKIKVDSEMVYQVVMKRSHTLDFKHEQVRDFVFALLKAQDKRIGRMEILEMEVPGRGDVLALKEEYESDKARINEFEQHAKELQADLDEMILRDVYNLDDEDAAVIDKFLSVW